jgi:urease accessory protein
MNILLKSMTMVKESPMLSRFYRPGLAAALVTFCAPSAAWAHVGSGSAHGFAPGFTHPIGGIDHVLAMVAVGLFAANLGGRALWAIPASFVGLMALGGLLGIQQIGVPYVELGIALSVIVLGLLVAAQIRWPVAAAMALVAVFAIFHGHAHGTEIPLAASGTVYASGFLIATALLHAAGIALGLATQMASLAYRHRIAQFGGGAIALAGVAILTGAV